MTSLLARVGALEARLASQIAWNSGKRKRGDWICAACTNRSAVKQKRAYSDDTVRPPGGIFPAFGLGVDEGDRERSSTNLPNWFRSVDRERRRDSDAELTSADFDTQFEDTSVERGRLYEDWERIEAAEETTEETAEPTSTTVHVEEGALSSNSGAYPDALLDLDYAAELGPAVLQGSFDRVARCLMAAARKDDFKFIQSIPQATFSACIRLLQPSNVSASLTSVHAEISAAAVTVFGVASVDQVAWENGKVLREIKTIRNIAGIRSTLEDYRMLLRAARDLGSRPMADNMWANMEHNGVTPDVECYNHYMASIVFNSIHSPDKRHRHRVIPFHKFARQRPRLGAPFAAYRIGEHGVKVQVTRFLNDMLRRGIIANEDSFRIVMTALAREGDTETLKSILRRMWNIDVDGLQSGKAEVSKPKDMDANNPLRPTTNMLFTVAHAFGINGDIRMALRLVDFISRHYALEVTKETWDQLFEWTFVLSVPRTGTDQDLKDVALPKQALIQLWDTMTGAPYFIEPTIGMYNHLIRNLQYSNAADLMCEKMLEALKLQRAAIQDASNAFKALRTAVKQQQQTPFYASTISLEALRHDYERLDLTRKRNHLWARRWMRKLLSTMTFKCNLNDSHWPLRVIPHLLREWAFLAGTAGNKVRYEVPGGQLEFQIRSEEELKSDKASRHQRAAARREVLDKVPLLLGEDWVFPKINARGASDAGNVHK